MQIIRHFHALPDALKGAVIAIGNFDGVHVGHRALIAEGQRIAKAAGRPFAILTFEPHPRRVFQPESPHIRLTTFTQKARLLCELGVDALFVQRFSPAFSHNSAEGFVETILIRQLGASHVITGAEFVFGKGRLGGASLLGKYASSFSYTPFVPVESGAQKVSSTRIRTFLSEGKCAEAAGLLTYPFSIRGRVRQGDKRGRTLGFPTANLAVYKRFLPRFGVYAVRVRVEEGSVYDGVANIGIRPMYDTKAPLLEAYLFDFSGDLYGRVIKIEFIEYLRGEVKFASEKELVNAMNEDAKKAKMILGNRPS